MKKITILVLSITLVLMFALTPKSHAYTLSNDLAIYYNQTTANVGQSDLLDISNTYIEYMYYDLGSYTLDGTTTRLVFSNNITTSLLPLPSSSMSTLNVTIRFYNSSNLLIYEESNYFNENLSFSYFETNFRYNSSYFGIDYITIAVSDLSIGYDEDVMHSIMHGAIISRGNTIINQTINDTSYLNGWADAMNSKVTQIWSLWGNIFDTFMSIFNVFSIKLMGDITIGHLAMVPLVLGLIGFIYALGGKRGR